MVPVRFIAEDLGAQVTFQNNTVMLNTNGFANSSVSSANSSSNNNLLLPSEGNSIPVGQDDTSGLTN